MFCGGEGNIRKACATSGVSQDKMDDCVASVRQAVTDELKKQKKCSTDVDCFAIVDRAESATSPDKEWKDRFASNARRFAQQLPLKLENPKVKGHFCNRINYDKLDQPGVMPDFDIGVIPAFNIGVRVTEAGEIEIGPLEGAEIYRSVSSIEDREDSCFVFRLEKADGSFIDWAVEDVFLLKFRGMYHRPNPALVQDALTKSLKGDYPVGFKDIVSLPIVPGLARVSVASSLRDKFSCENFPTNSATLSAVFKRRSIPLTTKQIMEKGRGADTFTRDDYMRLQKWLERYQTLDSFYNLLCGD